MRKLINLPSGSGKTYSFQTLASEGYAIIDLDAFVFKTGNGYVYHSDSIIDQKIFSFYEYLVH